MSKTKAKSGFSSAMLFLQDDDWDKALEKLRLTAELKEELDPVDRVHLLVSLGIAHVAAGEKESARIVFNAAKQLPPSPYLPNRFLAQCIASLDSDTQSEPELPGIVAKGRPVTMELLFLKSVIITAASGQPPTADNTFETSLPTLVDAFSRPVSNQPAVEKEKKRWWKLW